MQTLLAHPGDWYKVDGPFERGSTGEGRRNNRGKSLRKFAERCGHTVETTVAARDDVTWLYARTVKRSSK